MWGSHIFSLEKKLGMYRISGRSDIRQNQYPVHPYRKYSLGLIAWCLPLAWSLEAFRQND
jgi:hypothetical protein